MKTINHKEIEKFSKMAEEWWDPNAKFKPLHKFNPSRIQYIKSLVNERYKLKNNKKPFQGLSVLDIGCGGGLLSEPICRLGANITAIDASEKNIKIAKLHAKKNNLKINYFVKDFEKEKITSKYDVIIILEVLEHLNTWEEFVKKIKLSLKKNLILF